jgi:hypothetical protein
VAILTMMISKPLKGSIITHNEDKCKDKYDYLQRRCILQNIIVLWNLISLLWQKCRPFPLHH